MLRLRMSALVVGTAVLAAMTGGCQGSTRVEWVVSVTQDSEPMLQQLVQGFTASHPGQAVSLRNIRPEAFKTELEKMAGAKSWPTFVTMSHEQASTLPREWWANWGKDVAPAVSLKVLPTLWDHPLGMADAWCFPLWHQQYFTACNTALLEHNGVTHVPLSFGELARTAPEFRRKTGKYLWIPPLGDPDYAMALLDQQGIPIIDTHMKPLFARQGGAVALDWWVQQFQKGVFPMEALHLTRRQIQERFVAGDVGMATALPGEIAAMGSTPVTTLKNLGASRDLSGSNGNVRAVVFGLYHPMAAPLGMTAQNLVAYLMQPQVQRDLANSQNALPVSLAAIDPENPGHAQGGLILDRFAQVGAAAMAQLTTTVGGVPQRDAMAQAIREAFVSACEGKQSAQVALTAAEAKLAPVLAKSAH